MYGKPADADAPDSAAAVSPRHLRLYGVEVVVRDPDRSVDFYVNVLGFHLLADIPLPDGRRMIAVSPPDGSSILVLAQAPPGAAHDRRLRRSTGIFLVTTDIEAQYEDWSAVGVRFERVPTVDVSGIRIATFADPDGNTFNLIQSNVLTEQLESERQAAEEKEDLDRRAAREMEIARRVQSRLFPRNAPRVATLDCVGLCIPAREVGGDYYDLLDLGPGRLGIVMADVSGKGIAAALLMAHLQANLRSQSMRAFEDLAGSLENVNQLFHQNSSGASYTTVFFGAYDESTRRLKYANCGHLPGLVLRADGAVDRLASTCPVLGMFEDVKCVVDEVSFREDDMLVLYTDGLTDARNESGEEFGEDRLVEVVRRGRRLTANELLQSLVRAVQDFAGNGFDDDMAILVTRAIAAPGR